MNDEKLFACKLCKKTFQIEEMSDEHYPAKSVGNDDLVALNIVKLIDMLQSKTLQTEILTKQDEGKEFNEIIDDIFDNQLTESLYPKGRTIKSLCRKCNTFLGKYDEAYLRFFNANGEPKIINGFQTNTKYQIIKAIYAKFISLPETKNEEFDFVDFVVNESSKEYDGKWKLYFVKRDYSSDILNFRDFGTGKAEYDEGIVYEFSDEKFIFNLMNFEKHECYEMTNIFDILKKNYKLTVGVGKDGGYHASILMCRLFSDY